MADKRLRMRTPLGMAKKIIELNIENFSLQSRLKIAEAALKRLLEPMPHLLHKVTGENARADIEMRIKRAHEALLQIKEGGK